MRCACAWLVVSCFSAASARGGDMPAAADANAKIAAHLNAVTNVVANGDSLQEILAKLSKQHGISITIDADAVPAGGMVTIWACGLSIHNTSLDEVLMIILEQVGLVHVVEDGGLVVRPPTGRQRRKPAADAAQGVPKVAPEDKALARQYARHLQPVLQAELRLIHVVCETTPEEDARLAADGNVALQNTTIKIATQSIQRMESIGSLGPVTSEAVFESSYPALRKELAALVARRLPDDKAGRYRTELQQAAERARLAGVRAIVAELDQKLQLSIDQRTQILIALSKRLGKVGRRIDTDFGLGGYFPDVPDRLVTPYLNATQRSWWKSIDKSVPRDIGLRRLPDAFADEPEPADVDAVGEP